MTRARGIGLFAGVLLLALLATFPVGAGIALFGLDKAGLSARAANGTIWSGALAEARLGPVTLGDLGVAVRPLPLLIGRAEMGVTGAAGVARLIAGPTSFGVDNATGKLPLAAAFAPLPLDSLDLDDVAIRFRGGACALARGRVRATFAGDVAGLAVASGLSGVARCDGADLLLPLVGQSAMERLTLHIAGNGHWRAVLSVQSADPALATKLGAAGFQAVAGGYTLRLSGTL